MQYKKHIKTIIGYFLSPIGKAYTKNALTVFCFHDVNKNPSEFSSTFYLNVPPDIFETQVKFISDNFNVINVDSLLNSEVPEQAALITFDDGFKSYFTDAVPILTQYNMPSVNFLNIAPIEGEIFWSGLITYLCNKSPEFIEYINLYHKDKTENITIYLKCSRDIVNSFLKVSANTYRKEVDEYVGELATKKDLISVSSNNLVYFGNHLYNHDVPLLLTNKELLESYYSNENKLKIYSNYRQIFAFPFGQPITCYSDAQIKILKDAGAKIIFSAYPIVNKPKYADYLHRIPIYSMDDRHSNIWFSIMRKTIDNSVRNNIY